LLVKIANSENIFSKSKLIFGVDLAKIIVKAILLLEDAGVQVMGITGVINKQNHVEYFGSQWKS